MEVEEVGEEALRIKGSSAFMSSWSEEDDEEELSWFVYKSMAAITKDEQKTSKQELKTGEKIRIFFCQRPELKKKFEKKREACFFCKSEEQGWFGWLVAA